MIKLRTSQRVRATFVGKKAAPPPAPTSGANLWVDTNGGNCSRSAKGGNYADPQACGSFQAAYGAAQCGDVVGVRPGSYSSQTISSRKSCSPTTQVTFTSVPGAACSDNSAVSMPSFSISAAYVKLHCMNANPAGTNRCVDVSGSSHTSVVYISLDRVALHCGFFDSDHLHITNSTFGPDDVCQTKQEDMVVFRANARRHRRRRLRPRDLRDGRRLLPTSSAASGKHVDTIQGYGISNLVIANSIFYGCPGQCIIFRPYAGGTPGPITIRNTVFNQPQDPGQAVDIGSSTSRDGDRCNGPILIENNTFVNGADVHGGCWNNPTVIFRNNIMSGVSLQLRRLG